MIQTLLLQNEDMHQCVCRRCFNLLVYSLVQHFISSINIHLGLSCAFTLSYQYKADSDLTWLNTTCSGGSSTRQLGL